MGRIILTSAEETMCLGKAIAPLLKPNATLAISGDLGSGKTTFVQGLAQGLNIDGPILSPTFVYLNLYSGTLPLFHFDLYRLKRPSDFFALGFEEYLEKQGICAIEWPERIAPLPSAIPIAFSVHQKGRIAALPTHLLDSLESYGTFA